MSDDAAAAVGMLAQLPTLRGIKLGMHAYHGHEVLFESPNESEDLDEEETFPGWVQLPALAGLSAITELEVTGRARLPPDWRQLGGLRRMRVAIDWRFWPDSDDDTSSGDSSVPAVEGGTDRCFEWGSDPLTALTALTCLEASPPPGEAMQYVSPAVRATGVSWRRCVGPVAGSCSLLAPAV